jgi:hypothetical protein
MRTRYRHDDHYFDKCDSDQKAYWIGFLLADGNVKNNTLRLRLAVEAEETLQRFKRDLKTEAPVRKSNDGTFSIDITSATICAGVARYGIVPRKTFGVGWPAAIPKEHEVAFLLGLFDGDGTITHNKTRYRTKVYVTPAFAICGGSRRFLEAVVQKLSKHAGVGRNKVIRRKLKGVLTRTYAFSYQGAPALRIRDVLYACNAESFEGKKRKFFSYDYPFARPHDRRQQQERWNARVHEMGGELLSQYKGDSVPLKIRCGCGHVWSPRPVSLNQGTWCPCCAYRERASEQRAKAYDEMHKSFHARGWRLITTKEEYATREGALQFLCAHGVPHTRHCGSAMRKHATCDCETTNSAAHGERILRKRLDMLGWKLVSKYKRIMDYVDLVCRHGKPLRRIANNIRPEIRAVRCDCEKRSQRRRR